MDADELISGLKGYLSQGRSFGSSLYSPNSFMSDLGKSDQYDILTSLADPMKNDLLKWAAVLRGAAPGDISID